MNEDNTTRRDQQLEGLFGQAPKYSEHKKGEQIRFRTEGVLKTGTIVWVIPPGQAVEGGHHHGIIYAVDTGEGFPTMVTPGEVEEAHEEQQQQ